MARYFDVHPDNPQPRALAQVAEILAEGGLIAYPTDSCYALGCGLGNKEGLDRIRAIRQLDERHHFTLMCRDFAQMGRYVEMDNHIFKLIKRLTPGRYTFILKASRETPRMMWQPKLGEDDLSVGLGEGFHGRRPHFAGVGASAAAMEPAIRFHHCVGYSLVGRVRVESIDTPVPMGLPSGPSTR